MTYEQAVAWLEEILDRPLMLGFKINVRAVLAVLEREHEEAERYRWLRDGNAYFPEEQMIEGGSYLDEAIDAARKGVSDER